jgi:hypothetical protein
MRSLRSLLRRAALEISIGAYELKELVRGPAEPHAKGADLITAIEKGDRPAIRKLVEDNPGILKAEIDSSGNNALMCVASLAAEAGRQGDQPAADPIQPMGWVRRSPGAVPSRKLDSAAIESSGHLLLDLGADVNAINYWNRRPVLTMVAGSGMHKLVSRMVGKVAEIDAIDNVGHTSLMAAASQGHVETVEVLLDSGANKDFVNENGDSALSVTVLGMGTGILGAGTRYHTIFQELLRRGARINDKAIALAQSMGNDALAGALQREKEAQERARPSLVRSWINKLRRLGR